jgi:hypothetical protein
MEQVLDVYKRPDDPEHPVVCVDESPRQLIRETSPEPKDIRSVMTTNTNDAASATSSWQMSLWREEG